MYLSRLVLDPRHRDTWSWLGDCHRLHQVIMSGFDQVDGTPARAALGVLFRVEQPGPGGLIPVLVQSRERPDWSAVESTALRRPLEPARPLAVLEALFAAGATFRFRLRANPTRRVHHRATLGDDPRELDVHGQWREAALIPPTERTGVTRRATAEDARLVVEREDGKRIGKRVELRREEDRLAWLRRRGAEQDGFALLDVRLDDGREVPGARADPAGRLTGRRSRNATGVDQRLTFATALFEGVLRVTDPDRFGEAFREGIGPAKAFGCGLLSLAPRA